MKIILYIASILAIGGASYFSFEASAKFKKQQEVRLETIALNKNVIRDIEKTEGDLKKEQKLLAEEKTKRDELKASIEVATSTQGGLQRQSKELTNTLDEQKAEQKNVQEAMDLAIGEFRKAGLPDDITIDNIGEKINELKERRKQKDRDREQLAELVAGAESKLDSDKSEAGRQGTRRVAYENNIRQNAMEFPITAVDNDWGYVVIGAGQNHGFAPQGPLLVKRGGKLIGKLKPSSIEKLQTVADIDFDSISPGVRLQRGDMVMLATPVTN